MVMAISCELEALVCQKLRMILKIAFNTDTHPQAVNATMTLHMMVSIVSCCNSMALRLASPRVVVSLLQPATLIVFKRLVDLLLHASIVMISKVIWTLSNSIQAMCNHNDSAQSRKHCPKG